jgi:hypothetical protein
MTATGAALAPLVDALLAEPLDELDVAQLQAAITTVTPLVARLHGWLTTAAGQLDQLTGGTVPDPDGRARTTAGWLADVQHSTPSTTGGQLRTARLLRTLPLVTAAVLDGTLTPQQAAVLTRLVGRIDEPALVESQAAADRRRRHDGPHPARHVGRPPARHPLRTRLRGRAGPQPRPALPQRTTRG